MGDDSALGVSPEENLPEEVESDNGGRPEFAGLENHNVVVGVEPGDDFFLCIERVDGADLTIDVRQLGVTGSEVPKVTTTGFDFLAEPECLVVNH